MAEQINFQVDNLDKQDFVSWAILHTLAHHQPKNPQLKKIWDSIGPGMIEIEFKINGVKAPFSIFLHHIQQQMDEMVETEAKKLVLDRCGTLLTEVDNFTQQFRDRVTEIFPKARGE